MTNVNPENQSTTASDTGSGLPLRGLAMVLIAVAVLLAMWGLYSTTQNSGDSAETAAPETTTAAPATTAAPRESAVADSPEETTATTAAAENTETTEAPASEPAPAPAPAPAGAEEPGRLNVINNSVVPNLAADVADRLRADGFDVGEVGNMADHILPETTVFFQPGNADAETRARELAERVGGVARAYEGFLPENTDGRNDLTLVLVNQVAL